MTKIVLTVIDSSGKENKVTISLKPNVPFVFGRGEQAHFYLDDPIVSRHHFQIVWESGSLHVVDGGSTNGTLVNNERVDRRALAPHDVIVAGNAKIFLQSIE